jgi:hypothetical protein
MSSRNISAGTKVISESPGAFERGEKVPAEKSTFFAKLTED